VSRPPTPQNRDGQDPAEHRGDHRLPWRTVTLRSGRSQTTTPGRRVWVHGSRTAMGIKDTRMTSAQYSQPRHRRSGSTCVAALFTACGASSPSAHRDKRPDAAAPHGHGHRAVQPGRGDSQPAVSAAAHRPPCRPVRSCEDRVSQGRRQHLHRDRFRIFPFTCTLYGYLVCRSGGTPSGNRPPGRREPRDARALHADAGASPAHCCRSCTQAYPPSKCGMTTAILQIYRRTRPRRSTQL